MIDPEIKIYLDKYDKRLEAIQNKKEGLWWSFAKGVSTGLGYLVGVAIVIAVAGYILNAVGIIPGLRDQAKSWQQTLENLRQNR